MANTVAFFDIDGVINVFPYRKVWIGPEGTDFNLPWWETGMMDNRNWSYERELPDPELYFTPDVETVVTFPARDEWEKDRQLKLNFSTELISKINKLITDDVIDFRWNSMWVQNSSSVAATAFGLPLGLPYLPVEYYSSDTHQQTKMFHIEELYRDGAENRRFIWVDDVATENHVTHPEPYFFIERDFYQQKQIAQVERFIIQTKTQHGISREQWDALERFAYQQTERK